MTNEVTFTSCNQMDAYSYGWSGEKLLYTRHFISFPYFAMSSEVTFTTFNQMDTNSDTFWREKLYYIHVTSLAIHPSQYVTASQTVTKSYVCEQIHLLCRRHFTGQPASTITNEVTFNTIKHI